MWTGLDRRRPDFGLTDREGGKRIPTIASRARISRSTAGSPNDWPRIGIATDPPGARLPSEAQLAREFGVSRGTVRQALGSLSSDGLTEVVASRGTYVRRLAPVKHESATARSAWSSRPSPCRMRRWSSPDSRTHCMPTDTACWPPVTAPLAEIDNRRVASNGSWTRGSVA